MCRDGGVVWVRRDHTGELRERMSVECINLVMKKSILK